MMDPTSVNLIIGAIAQGLGVAMQWAELARRVKAGEIITIEEVQAASEQVEASVARWNAAADMDEQS